MLRYDNKEITFSELPDEISLAYTITNCNNKCKGCHSPWLRQNVGTLIADTIEADLNKYTKRGITAICFLGESLSLPNAEETWRELVNFIRSKYPKLKIAMYSGRDKLPPYADIFDYFKLGSYKESLGGLTDRRTNQRLYKVNYGRFEDITYKFWRD